MTFMEKTLDMVILGLLMLVLVLLGFQVRSDFFTDNHFDSVQSEPTIVPLSEYPTEIAEYLAKSDLEFQVHTCTIRAHYASDNASVEYWVAQAQNLPEFGHRVVNLNLGQSYENSFGSVVSDQCFLLTYHSEANPSLVMGKIYIPNLNDWYAYNWEIGTVE